MTQRKLWSFQEDQFLIQLVQIKQNTPQSRDKKWADIADQLNTRFKSSQRTGKQCRQRWHNQLDPSIKKQQQWTAQQETKIFELQKKLGNKWAQIARQLKGRSDNNVKNFFYSTLRKSLRKLNTFISNNKSELKNAKQFKTQSLAKLLAVADHKYDKKVNIKGNDTQDQAVQIKNILIQISKIQQIQKKHKKTFINLVEKMQNFNKSCKKKKCKRKISQQGLAIDSEQQPKLQSLEQPSQSDEQDHENQVKQYPKRRLVTCIDRSRSRNKPKNFIILSQRNLTKSKSQKQDQIKQDNYNAKGNKVNGKVKINEKGEVDGKGKVKKPQIINTDKNCIYQVKQPKSNSQLFKSFGDNSINLNQKPKPSQSKILDNFLSIQQSQDLKDRNQGMPQGKPKSSSFFDTIKTINGIQKRQSQSNMSYTENAQYDYGSYMLGLMKGKQYSIQEINTIVKEPSQMFPGFFQTHDFAPVQYSSFLDSSRNYDLPILKSLRSYSQRSFNQDNPFNGNNKQ